jgi:hypothetical protein
MDINTIAIIISVIIFWFIVKKIIKIYKPIDNESFSKLKEQEQNQEKIKNKLSLDIKNIIPNLFSYYIGII